MVKNIFAIATLFFLLFALPLETKAQSADCSTFNLSPSSVEEGEIFRVIKTDGLSQGHVVRATILNSSIPQQVIDCEGNPSLCSENPTGLLEFNTSSLDQGSYSVEIFFFNGANTCTTTRSVSVTGAASEFCSQTGITEASPLLFSPNEDIGFSGCLGPGTNPDNPCNGQSRIVVLNTETNQLAREFSLTGTPGSCNPDGTFTTSFGGFDTGTYSAQLYIGTGSNAAPTGGLFVFEVESGADQQPDEGNPCTTISAGLVCSGTFQRDESNQLRCTFETDQCVSCSECTEPQCSRTQVAACQNSRSNTAALVACNATLGTVNTAIGCIPFDVVSQTARFFLQWSISIGGGLSLLLIGVSALMFATSSGNPDKVNNAKSVFYGAITGLLFIILSVFLLRAIGVDVLGLFS